MAKSVRIYQEECIGSEACVETCPAFFDFNNDELAAFFIKGADSHEDCVDEWIASCSAEGMHRD